MNNALKKSIDNLYNLALKEDEVKNDITSKLTVTNKKIEACLIFKENGVLSGTDVIKYIINKFNKQISIRDVEKDQVYNDVSNIAYQYDLKEFSHDAFINNLIPLRRVNYSQKLSIFSKSHKTIYYKLLNNNKKTIQFGEILQSNELNLDLDNDFLIDLSNINNIEKIIYRGIEIKVNDFLNFYLVNFSIKDLETLL